MKRFELEFSSKIILGEGFRDKKVWFGYWLQHLQIVNLSSSSVNGAVSDPFLIGPLLS